jgi:hypothetical protein
VVEIWTIVALEQVKAIQDAHPWSLYASEPELYVDSGARETHNTSRFRYRCPVKQVENGGQESAAKTT